MVHAPDTNNNDPITHLPILVTESATPDDADAGRRLAEQFRWPIIRQPATHPLYLQVQNQQLALHCNPKHPPPQLPSHIGPLSVDWQQPAILKRYHQPNQRKPLLIKAVGIDNPQTPVIDATAGLGTDTATLASAGLNVLAIERHSVLFALLQDGHRRACLADVPWAKQITLAHNDAIQLLSQIQPTPQAVVLDPMYPPSGKKASPTKAMQYCRMLLGQPTDTRDLFQAAWQCGIQRLIVKRPPKAAPITDRQPNGSITGKSVRFDIYTR